MIQYSSKPLFIYGNPSLCVPTKNLYTRYTDGRQTRVNYPPLQEGETYAYMDMDYVSYCIHFSYKLLCVILVASLKLSLWWVERIVALSRITMPHRRGSESDIFLLICTLCGIGGPAFSGQSKGHTSFALSIQRRRFLFAYLCRGSHVVLKVLSEIGGMNAED